MGHNFPCHWNKRELNAVKFHFKKRVEAVRELGRRRELGGPINWKTSKRLETDFNLFGKLKKVAVQSQAFQMPFLSMIYSPPNLLLLATYLVAAMEWPLLSYFHTNLHLGNPARSWAENMKHQSARCSVLNFSLFSASSLYYKPSKVLLAARLPKYLWLWHHIPPIIHVSLTKPSETWYNFSCSIFPSTSFFHCETDNICGMMCPRYLYLSPGRKSWSNAEIEVFHFCTFVWAFDTNHQTERQAPGCVFGWILHLPSK